MRTETITIYKFSELPTQRAKERAKDHFREDGFRSDHEAMKSITALAEHFDGKIDDWSIDWTGGSYSRMTFDMPELSGREIKRRLQSLGRYNRRTGRGIGDCKLTGWCWDESCIDGFRKAFRGGERDVNKLMEAAFRELLKDTENEYEGSFEDANFAEWMDGNEYEFYENGELV
jgi:hypothetical protein